MNSSPRAESAARLRRSMLMTPGNRADRMHKAASYGADALVLDLEDSVPPAAKAQARGLVAHALRELQGCGRELCVRINTLASGFGADDLAALPLALLDSVMVPKVESPAELHALDTLLQSLEAAQGVPHPRQLVVMLETPRGVLQALPIAEACTRTTALFFGSGDYTAATGAAITASALLFARSAIAAAAGAVGIQAIDAAYFLDVRNGEATRADALAARELGFAGKVVFHPAQVPVANAVFSPTPAEVQRAERVVAGYREALARGHGTALSDGVFVAIDLVGPAERLLHRAALVQQRDRHPAPHRFTA
jgi:citrate lyase subunit beta/citryl-CoA lyase